jgi:periplasmic protein TonB
MKTLVVLMLVLMGVITLPLGGIARAQENQSSASDNVYKVGNGVTPPKGIYMPNPQYSEKGRKKKINGTVLVTIIVNADGTVRDAKVTRGLERSLDQQAIVAVSKWKFEPATKDGKPVAVHVPVEVDFRLY